jgi:uncharacterized caspase-like protein
VLRYTGPLEPPALHLVTVSVNRYADAALSLDPPERDAAAITQVFRQRGASLYAKVNTASIADSQATKAGVLQAIRDTARLSKAQDTLVVYLSGQGLMHGEQYYFLPREFPSVARLSPAELQSKAIAAPDVGEAMAAGSALKRLLVFDTGHAGHTNRTARSPFAFRGAVERLSRSEGAFTIAVGPVPAVQAETADAKHSLLTYTLLAGLHAVDEGPLENQWIRTSRDDGVAHVLEWFAFAARHLPQLGPNQDVQHAGAGTSFPLLPVTGARMPAVASATNDQTPAGSSASPQPARPAVEPEVHGDRPLAHVVAVGVNRYRQSAMNLQYAAPDASAIAELFRRRGETLYGATRIQTLLDDQATRAGILDAVKQVAATAQPDDVTVLFLAGHGAMVGQRYYFIPHEFQHGPGSADDDIRRLGLPADTLADALGEVRALKQLLILDTCASGSVFQLGHTLRDPVAFRRFVERLGQRQGVFTIAAAAAGEAAQEIDELRHGALTYALLAALHAVPPGPLEGKSLHAANSRGQAEVLDWFSFAAGHVPRLTKHFLGQEQTVQVSGQGRSFNVLPAGEY